MSSQSPREPASFILPAAIFLSAFLLFQIQPLSSKIVLPWFGGTSAVWTTCLLFFQTALFGGYLYAHLVASRLPVRFQAIVHLLMLVAAAATLSILPGPELKPIGGQAPVARILHVLAVTVGFPYFVLSTTGPLLQWWFSVLYPGRSPYRLYALSNAGSLLALASYPFLVEPMLAVGHQANFWTIGFWIFAVLCGVCAVQILRKTPVATTPIAQNESELAVTAPSFGNYVLWFLLAMTASAMLLAMTNHVGQDAVMPFLWVFPLGLYLLSFIVCFDSDRWYWSRTYAVITAALVIGACEMNLKGSRAYLPLQAAVYFATLFAICMLCHGELAARRPVSRYLTHFYLTMSAGGAAGGLLVAVAAPLIFNDYWEFYGGMVVAMLVAIEVFFDRAGWFNQDRSPPLLAKIGAVVLLSAIGVYVVDAVGEQQGSMATIRNFYGVLHVEEELRADDDNNTVETMTLRHGRIAHGLQYVNDADRLIPTTYYTEVSGAGRAIAALRERKPNLRIGAIGLGTGTMAAYGKPGDVIRFYEINENVERVARKYFTFLESSQATIEIVLGDARLSLEREESQNYDLLIVDAFSGDAIPTHLLTREAIDVYRRHMAGDGIIAFHISNLHFDLRPVVDALADAVSETSVTLNDNSETSPGHFTSVWTLVSKDAELLNAPVIQDIAMGPDTDRILWTDGFCNLWGVLSD